MADLAKLKKKALEHEQKKQFDKALQLYIQIIEESAGSTLDDTDVSLFNRVGDLLVKNGNVGDAVGYYERAVDLYTDGGFLNNAIALCNKILRQSPGRTSVYYKLGKISAQKGFNSDARKNYLEYADRMQRESQLDEAFRALAEFCDLCPGQDDIRLMLADQLNRQGKGDAAIQQLQILYDSATAEGRTAEANAAAERMRAINPEIEVKAQEETKRKSKSDGLVFLDLNDAAATPGKPAPPPAPVEMPDALELSNQLTVPPTPTDEAAVGLDPHDARSRITIQKTPLSVDVIDLEPVVSGQEDAAPTMSPDLPMLDTGEPTAAPAAAAPAPDVEMIDLSPPAAGPPAAEEEAPSGGPDLVFLTPLGSELQEAPAAAASEEPMSEAEAEAAEEAAEEADAAAAGDVPPADAEPAHRGSLAGLPLINTGTPAGIASFGAEYGMPVEEEVKAPEGADDIEVAFLTPPIVPVVHEKDTSIHEDELITSALTPMASDVVPAEPPPSRPSRKSTSLLARSVDGLSVRVAAEPENWSLRRSYGEALLEDGQREEGLRELDASMVGFEKAEDLLGARSVADEIVRVNPNSVRHHQKRVEFCFRSNDRAGLVEAYLELADALFRDGQQEKSRAVYQRVIELQPGNVRAESALATFGPAPVAPPIEPPTGRRATTAVRSTTALKRYTGSEAGPPAALEPTPASTPSVPAGGGGGGGGDDDFVDLGDWLRDDEPVKDTRMVVDEEEPTGDEQADFADMLAKFKQGVAENVEEEDYDSHYDLGVAYKEMGLVDEAIAEFQKALRGTNHRARAYESLGQCFIEKGHFQVAVTILSRAIAEPNMDAAQLVGVLYLLGNTYEALEQPKDALGAYQRVYAEDINFRDVGQRIKSLARAAK